MQLRSLTFLTKKSRLVLDVFVLAVLNDAKANDAFRERCAILGLLKLQERFQLLQQSSFLKNK